MSRMMKNEGSTTPSVAKNAPATQELQKYTKDFNVWVPPDGGSMGVEASSLNGIITLCIENKAEMPGLAGMIRTAFEKEDITVLEAVDLDT